MARRIAPRSTVMLALDILEGRARPEKPARAREEAKQAAPRAPAAKKQSTLKGKTK